MSEKEGRERNGSSDSASSPSGQGPPKKGSTRSNQGMSSTAGLSGINSQKLYGTLMDTLFTSVYSGPRSNESLSESLASLSPGEAIVFIRILGLLLRVTHEVDPDKLNPDDPNSVHSTADIFASVVASVSSSLQNTASTDEAAIFIEESGIEVGALNDALCLMNGDTTGASVRDRCIMSLVMMGKKFNKLIAVQRHIAYTMANIHFTPQMSEAAIRDGIVNYLNQLISSDSEEMKVSGYATLWNLCVSDISTFGIADNIKLKTIVKAAGENTINVVKKSRPLQLNALGVLATMAKRKTLANRIVAEANVIHMLKDVLSKVDHSEVVTKALSLLDRLVVHADATVKARLVKEHFVQILCSLAKSDVVQNQLHISCTFYSMVILEPGLGSDFGGGLERKSRLEFIKSLAGLLKSPSHETVGVVLSILDLMAANADAAKDIASEDCLEGIITALSSSMVENRLASAKCVASLAKIPQVRGKLVKNGALLPITQILSSSPDDRVDVQQEAINALLHLSIDDSIARKIVVFGGTEMLSRIISFFGEEYRTEPSGCVALKVLGNLLFDDFNREMFLDEYGLEPFESCLVDENKNYHKDIRHLAMRGLAVLGENDKLSEYMGDSIALSRMQKKRGLRILALDGGGTRGVCLTEMLKHIEVMTGHRIQHLFDFVCGTSTGGMLSAVLFLSGKNVRDCERAYKELATAIFKKNPINMAMNALSGARYDSSALDSNLQAIFRDDVLIESVLRPGVPKFMCVAAEVTSNPTETFLFRNYQYPNGQKSRYNGSCRPQVWEACRCTSAAPSFFMPYYVNHKAMQDGGIQANNPAGIAIHEAKKLWPDTPIDCLVSLGTGEPKRGPNSAKPTGAGWKGLLTSLVDGSADPDRVHHVLEDLLPPEKYFRFNPTLPSDREYDLDETRPEALEFMQEWTRGYMLDHSSRFAKCCEVLKINSSRHLLPTITDTSEQGLLNAKIRKRMKEDNDAPRFVTWLKDGFEAKENRIGKSRVATHPLQNISAEDLKKYEAMLSDLGFDPQAGKRTAFGRKYMTAAVPAFLDGSDESLRSFSLTLNELLEELFDVDTPALSKRMSLARVPAVRVRINICEGDRIAVDLGITFSFLALETPRSDRRMSLGFDDAEVVQINDVNVMLDGGETSPRREVTSPIPAASPEAPQSPFQSSNAMDEEGVEKFRKLCHRVAGLDTFKKDSIQFLMWVCDAVTEEKRALAKDRRYVTVHIDKLKGDDLQHYKAFLMDLGLKPDVHRRVPFGRKFVSIRLPEFFAQDESGGKRMAASFQQVITSLTGDEYKPRTRKMNVSFDRGVADENDDEEDPELMEEEDPSPMKASDASGNKANTVLRGWLKNVKDTLPEPSNELLEKKGGGFLHSIFRAMHDVTEEVEAKLDAHETSSRGVSPSPEKSKK